MGTVTLLWNHPTWLHPHKSPDPGLCLLRCNGLLLSSAQGCRKPLPWLQRDAISYLHPPSPQYRLMVQGLRGLPRSPSIRAEPTLLCRALGAAPWLVQVALSCSWFLWLCWQDPEPWCSGGSHACPGHLGGPQLPWSCTRVPPPHLARHPQSQQLHRTHALASPSCELFPAAVCAGRFWVSVQEVSEGLAREEEMGEKTQTPKLVLGACPAQL